MADKDQVQQDKLLTARLTDAARLCGFGRPCFVGFLDLHQQEIAESLMHKICPRGCKVLMDGGFPEAERRVVGFFAEEDEPVFPITGLKICYSSKFANLTHRDFLGALLSLGIKRETVGDIVVSEGEAVAAVLSEVAPFIQENLKTVGRAGVYIETAGDFCYNNKDNVDLVKVSVASNRIDAILAAVSRLSREKAVRLIAEGRVRLNHLTVTDKSYEVRGTELLSVTGLGRWRLDGFTGTSRKGRLFLSVKAFR